MRRRTALAREDAASRVTAFVYGNVVALASLVPLTQDDAENGRSAVVVLTVRQLLDEVRDSVPVLSAGLVCAVVLALAWVGGVPGHLAVAAAEGWVLLRLAATGPIVGAIRGERVSARTVLAGAGLAVAGACVTGAKLALTH